jgi:NADH dehydrogenase
MNSALEDPMTFGQTYQLAGPLDYTLKELVQWTARTMGKKRWVIGLPQPLSVAMAAVMGMVPGKPLSLDNYRSLKTDNVSDENGFARFGVTPRSIDTVVPDYLSGSLRQRRLKNFRERSRP